MGIIEKLIMWILLSNLCQFEFVTGGSVTLNGPPIQTEDLRAIDGYVASGLPLFASTKGFVLHTGMRPVIVKVKDPNKEVRDGIEQPNPSYYRNLPSVIPEGYEGIATTSFQLGHPIVHHLPNVPNQHQYTSQFIGNTVQVQQQQNSNGQNFLIYQVQNHNKQQHQFRPQQQQPQQQQPFQPQQQYNQVQTQSAEPSIRVESRVNPGFPSNQLDADSERLTTNPVVVETSNFESNLPTDLKNPFYSNQMLAFMLARESLPVLGEEVVQKWDTNKIRQGRVRDLLLGAGFIS